MILRTLSGIGGLTMLGYGCYGLATAVMNPSLRMFWTQGGSDMVQVMGRDVQMSARLFVVLIYIVVLAYIFGGLWLCAFTFRRKGDDGG